MFITKIENLGQKIMGDENISLDMMRAEFRDDQAMIDKILLTCVNEFLGYDLGSFDKNELIAELKDHLDLLPQIEEEKDRGIEDMQTHAARLLESSLTANPTKVFEMAKQFE